MPGAQPGAIPGGFRGAVDLSPLVNRQAAAEAPRRREPAPDGAGAEAPLVVEVGDPDLPRLVEVSRSVPVLVALVADWSTPSQQLLPVLQTVVESLAGRVLLAIVDQAANPQLTGAFQAQSVPTVAAIVAGSPVPLFQGTIDEERLRALLDRLLELAEQNGVSGSLNPGSGDAEAAAPAEPEPAPEPPLHFEAYEAIDRQDYAEAARLFRLAIAQDPRDTQAVAALAQVELLDRVQSVPDDARTRAADDFRDIDAALAVADLDIAGGHVDDALDRLLGLIPSVHGDDRTRVRTRLLDYFEIAGTDDPRVTTARRRLAMLLY